MDSAPFDAFAPAGAMLDALRRRKISAVELLDLHLARIERYNPALNAIVTFDFERARQATAADAAYARGEQRALLGLPITIKDTIDAAGLPGTAGIVQDRVPAQDAPVAARVRAAGAVLMGKTNVPPYAGDWQAVNPIFGRTNNPWDASRSPGGCTGGGAAAVAAALTPLEFGSDIGGSIRVPAAFCGVFGHKPSETAVPRSGHFPGAPLPNAAAAMGVQGPLARAAEDLELALDCIAGPDTGEDVAWRLELPPARHTRLADFRVAILPPIPWVSVDPEILAAQDELAQALSRAGCRVGVAAPEPFGDFSDQYALYLKLLFVMMSLGMSDERRRHDAETLRRSGDRFAEPSVAGILASAADYIVWNGQRASSRAVWGAFFREWDVVMSPANIVPAFEHTDAPFSQRTLVVDGKQVPYSRQSVYPSMATLPGLPATAFPAGATSSGLPIGLQAIGAYLEDRTPIRFAALLTREYGGFRQPPGYDDGH